MSYDSHLELFSPQKMRVDSYLLSLSHEPSKDASLRSSVAGFMDRRDLCILVVLSHDHLTAPAWLEKETSWSGNSLWCGRGFSELETLRRRLLTWRDPETTAMSSRAEEERPLGGKTHTRRETDRGGGRNQAMTDTSTQRQKKRGREKQDQDAQGRWRRFGNTLWFTVLSEKVQSYRGSASWYLELPHFPREEAELKRVPEARLKQKLQAAEQDNLWYWASLSLIKSSSEEAREPTTIVVQLPSRVWLIVTPWSAARQNSLSFTISWSLLNLMSTESVILFNYLILCWPRGKCGPLESSASCPRHPRGFLFREPS